MLTIPKAKHQITINAYSKVLRAIKDHEGKLNDISFSKELAFIWNSQKDIERAKLSDINTYAERVLKVLDSDAKPVKHVFRLDGVAYGLEPNISQMSWGAFEDAQSLSRSIEEGNNLARLMAILYRPVNGNVWLKKIYNIKGYNDEAQYQFERRAELFGKALSLCELDGVLSFFLTNQKR